MNSKGFVDNQTNIDTPNDISLSEKPLESKNQPHLVFLQIQQFC